MSIAKTYDVVIMGGGWAGNCQARHLLLNVSGIRLAIVEPRTDEQVVDLVDDGYEGGVSAFIRDHEERR